MGIEYSIFDRNRKEFISLYKWKIVDGIYEAIFENSGHFPQVLIDECPCAIIPKSLLLKSISEYQPEFDYIKQLAAYIPGAIAQWDNDEIYFCADWAGEPWDYDKPRFCDWMELPGPDYHHPWLPRNLIQIHGCKIWDDALPILEKEYLLDQHKSTKSILESIKRKFDSLIHS